jgi:MoaA/NifB/PqqE/SkfB family radical SAM enzyme
MADSILKMGRKLLENGAFDILLHPRVVANHLRYQRELGRRPERMTAAPSTVEIELTNRCNLACIQCLRSQGCRPYRLGDIDLGDFERLLEQFPKALHLSLNGFGEPLMHPRFFDALAIARRRLPWAKISIYSNGMLIDEAAAAKLPGSGLTELNVSIDAASPEVYRRVRRGGELEVVHENLRRLIAQRARRGVRFPLVGTNFVMLNDNEGELVPFVEQSAALGVDFVNCISYATYDWGFKNRRTPASYASELAQAKERLEELSLPCRSFPAEDISWASPTRRFDCDFFWGGSVRVTFEGHLTLGCCTPFKETFSYGCLLQTPFEELWNGPLMQAQRRAAAEGRPPNPICGCCDVMCKSFFVPQG